MDASPTIQLDRADNVIVAKQPIEKGYLLQGLDINTLEDIPQGHKIAARPIAKGEAVLKYNTIIGYAGEDIASGAWVHSHNLKIDTIDKDYRFAQDYLAADILAPQDRAKFMGYVRKDGRVGTRNHIGIFVTVNCSATVAQIKPLF